MKQTEKKKRERERLCKEEIQNNDTRGLTSTAARNNTLSQDTLRFGLVSEGSVF